MGTRENKNAKIVNLRHPRKFKPAKIRACTVSDNRVSFRFSRSSGAFLSHTSLFQSPTQSLQCWTAHFVCFRVLGGTAQTLSDIFVR